MAADLRLRVAAVLVDAEDRPLGNEGERVTSGDEEGMCAAHLELVAEAVGNDEQRAILWEVLRALQQVDPRLQDGAATAANAHGLGDGLGRQVALVVGGGIAEDDAHRRDLARQAIAGDGAERFRQEFAVHRARGVEHDAEGAPLVPVWRRHPARPWNSGRGGLSTARPRIGVDALPPPGIVIGTARQLDIPGDRRLTQRLYLLD